MSFLLRILQWLQIKCTDLQHPEHVAPGCFTDLTPWCFSVRSLMPACWPPPRPSLAKLVPMSGLRTWLSLGLASLRLTLSCPSGLCSDSNFPERQTQAPISCSVITTQCSVLIWELSASAARTPTPGRHVLVSMSPHCPPSAST